MSKIKNIAGVILFILVIFSMIRSPYVLSMYFPDTMPELTTNYYPRALYLLKTSYPFSFSSNTYHLEFVGSITSAKKVCTITKTKYGGTSCKLFKLDLTARTIETVSLN